MIKRFFLYGFFGLLLEVLWTGINNMIRHDKSLRCTTSLWMFPIYGMGIAFEPIINLIIILPMFVRGVTYMLCIFLAEYYSGSALRRYAVCPWDYSNSSYNVQGLIRLDYAPLWFMVGLAYEWAYMNVLIKI